jgi:dipeptidyl aminopeptidase/acylaminoacyl peptidase
VTNAIIRYGCARFWFRFALLAAGPMNLWFSLSAIPVAGQEPPQKRPATVEDAIRMVRIAGHLSNLSYEGALTENFAYFSPDRKQFVVILKKGNLETNTNDYSLVLFRTDEAFSSPTPRSLVTMNSSSNREAITDAAWLADNRTILFRGENPGETSQLYAVDVKSGELRKLTHHPTSIVAFSSDAKGERIAYAAEKPLEPVITETSKRNGVVVAHEDMTELLMGERTDDSRELFLLDVTTDTVRQVAIDSQWKGKVYGSFLNLSLAPDGNHLVVSLNLTEVPARWHEYREPTMAQVIKSALPANSLSWIFRYLIIDLASGRAKYLFDGPLSYRGSEVVWGPDSRDLILTGVFLPIEEAAGSAKNLAVPATVAVDIESLQYAKLSDEDLRLVRRENAGTLLIFEARTSSLSSAPSKRFSFRREGGRWVSTEAPSEAELPVEVIAKQDLNTPPAIMVFDRSLSRHATLLDPNPQLREIAFGKVQDIKFAGAKQREVHAGLYFPVGYVPGKKYPLVVQTHGFDPKSFWIDGSFTTAFAAQALAARGFLVLQVPDTHADEGTPDEAPDMAETLEHAVDFVNGLGCLDLDRVGIIGFSRTGLYVHYLLTRSRLHFRAAVIADGSDGGYSQYLQFLNAHQYTASDSEALNGGMPFGSGLLYWLRRSPEFSLDMIDTPVMFQVSSPRILPTMWASFVGLRRLDRPVELVYFPTGSHIMEKPWDRLASQGGSVDWFAFWLKGEEDPNPSKTDEYKRWRGLRALQGHDERARK